MINELIVSLVRTKLGLKKFERFQFTNQKSPNEYYYFTDSSLLKACMSYGSSYIICESGVSLNWLLNDNCKIRKVSDVND